MLNIIKETMVDILSLPKGTVCEIKEFSTHTLILIDGNEQLDRTGEMRGIHLPGNITATSQGYTVPVYGIKTPDRNILAVLDSTEAGITDEDLDFYQDLEQFNFFCSMTHKDYYPDTIFKPLDSLVKSTPIDSIDGVVAYKTHTLGKTVHVREGSNRHKFINGQSDFFSDPLDFYATANALLKPENIERVALNLDISVEEYLETKITEQPVDTMLTLLTSEGIRETVVNAIRLRNSDIKCKFTYDMYWEEGFAPEPELSAFSEIDWEAVAEELRISTNDGAGFVGIAWTVMLDAEPDTWEHYNLHIFFMFYLILTDETVKLIDDTFNLTKED